MVSADLLIFLAHLWCAYAKPVCHGSYAVQKVASVSTITPPRGIWIKFKFIAYIYQYLNLCLLGFGDVPYDGYVIKAP